MKEYSYLTFSLNNYLYGISTIYVEEIFPLPELKPILKASSGIVGTVNLRGDILPVVDVNLRFGYQSQDYQVTDSVVVLRWEQLRVGIIVNEFHEVKSISPEDITTELSHEQDLAGFEYKRIIAGTVGNEEDIIILGKPGNWLRVAEIQQITSVEFTSHISKLLLTQQLIFCPNATPEERAIFRERADNLKLSTGSQGLKTLRPLTVFVLNGNFFGIDLKIVREFTDIRRFTPIPCVGAHIIGNMNLRGEILTLVDIRGLFNRRLMHIAETSKVMVVEVESIVAGVVVEEVCDVMFFLNPLQITAMPTVMHAIHDEYIQGTAPYRKKMMTIIDLPTILLHGGLIVDEAI